MRYRYLRWLSATGVAAALLCSVGCVTIEFPYSPTPTPPPVPPPVSYLAFGYVASSISGTLSQFQISSSGLWGSLSPAEIAIPRFSESLVVDPSGRFVYVANANGNTVTQYVIDVTTGALSPNQPATVATGVFPQWLATDALGRFLYVANTQDSSISMYTIDQTTGALQPTVPATVPFLTSSSGLGAPDGLVVDPLGRFVFVDGGNTVDTYAIDSATGLLVPGSLQVAPVGAQFPPAVDPTGTFLYIPYSSNNTLEVFAINPATGGLTPAAVPSVPVGEGASSVAIDPSGKYLYVVNRQSQTISQFNIGAGGSLTPMATPTVSDPGFPWQILVDPSGQLAYVSNEDTASVTIYRIGTDGSLLEYASAPAGLGAGGMGVARRR